MVIRNQEPQITMNHMYKLTIVNSSSKYVCYTGFLNGILHLKTTLSHCHHIIENYCVNLDLLTR